MCRCAKHEEWPGAGIRPQRGTELVVYSHSILQESDGRRRRQAGFERFERFEGIVSLEADDQARDGSIGRVLGLICRVRSSGSRIISLIMQQMALPCDIGRMGPLPDLCIESTADFWPVLC